ncbi:MAG: DUF3025 domain-containing protein [Pseudomonadota bacterium]
MFDPLLPLVGALPSADWPDLAGYESLRIASGQAPVSGSCAALRFVAQPAKKPKAFEQRYEPRIYLTGEVPTRLGNWHDLFNALVWLTFPRAKAEINRRHYLEIERATASARRGAVRDALTLFDESGVIVACGDEDLAGLLRGFQWKQLFWDRRQAVQQRMRFYLFGHGLYEKALSPFIGLTGNAVILPVADSFFAASLVAQLQEMDVSLARWLSTAENLAPRSWMPLPLLGVPGWTRENESGDFYDNDRYFRGGRNRRAQGEGKAGAAGEETYSIRHL